MKKPHTPVVAYVLGLLNPRTLTGTKPTQIAAMVRNYHDRRMRAVMNYASRMLGPDYVFTVRRRKRGQKDGTVVGSR